MGTLLFSWGNNINYHVGSYAPRGMQYTPVEIDTSNMDGNRIGQIALNDEAAYALTTNGKLFGWGSNTHGLLLTDDLMSYYLEPTLLETSKALRIVGETINTVTSSGLTVVLNANEYYTSFGYNLNGALGNGKVDNVTGITPIVTSTIGKDSIISVSSSTYRGAIVTVSTINIERVYTFGDNQYNAIGSPIENVYSPRSPLTDGVLAGKLVTSVQAGTDVTIALADGNVYSWGDNRYGALGVSDIAFSLVPIAVNTGALSGLTITKISCTRNSVAAIASNGRLIMWGNNMYGNLGDGTLETRSNPAYVPYFVFGRAVADVSSGETTTIAATVQGQVYTWGYNEGGLLGIPALLGISTYPVFMSNTTELIDKFFVKVAMGNLVASALTSGGELYTWGTNGKGGNLGINSNSFQIFYEPQLVATNNMPGLVTSMCISDNNAAAIANGKIYTWGKGSTLWNGVDDTFDRYLPTLINMTGALQGLTVESISCGSNIVAVATDGVRKVFVGWGANAEGALGTGDANPVQQPTVLSTHTASNLTVSASNTHTIYLSVQDQSPSTTATPTPVLTPTTSIAPTTTTQAPTSSATTTTTKAPSPTIIGPTSPPVIVVLKPQVKSETVGNVTLLPPQPIDTNQAVLFVTDKGNTKSQLTVSTQQYSIAEKSIVASATLSVEIVKLDAPVTLEIVGIDSNMNIVGRVTVQVTKAGILPVDISSLFRATRRVRQIIIGGKYITFTMNVLTPDVPVTVNKNATSVSFSVISPATEKPSLSAATSSKVGFAFIMLLALII